MLATRCANAHAALEGAASAADRLGEYGGEALRWPDRTLRQGGFGLGPHALRQAAVQADADDGNNNGGGLLLLLP